MTKPNRDSRLREHLANERTFLAWLRTSIALIGFGLAIARFGLFLRQGQPQNTITQQIVQNNPVFNSENLGLSLVIVGIVVIALAAWRYNRVFRQIERADYQPNRSLIWLLSSIVILLGILSIPLLLARRSSIYPGKKLNSPQSRYILKNFK
ncbi:MAG: YidH family protein [Rivularia sp. (in: cyanobacteria)]